MELLKNKKALILGVANERSIAWGIAQEFKKNGAQIALTYPNTGIEKRVIPLSNDIKADFVAEVDVGNDDHLKNLAAVVKKNWGTFDILIHSIAYAEREDLSGRFVATSRQGFQTACDISAYSLIGLCQHLYPLMPKGSSVQTLTYYGSQKVVKNYNIMGVAKAALESTVRYLAQDLGQEGIRVNAISAGPIKTLAASGISGFRSMLNEIEEKAPLKINVDTQDVGSTAVYLASDLSKNVTGQILYVDSGLSILGY